MVVLCCLCLSLAALNIEMWGKLSPSFSTRREATDGSDREETTQPSSQGEAPK